MEVFAQGIGQFRLILLLACLAGFIIFFLTGVVALRNLGRASFRLERSSVVNRALGSMLRALLCLFAGGVIWYVTGLMGRPAAARPLTATNTPYTIVISAVPTADLNGAALVAQSQIAAADVPKPDSQALPTPSLIDGMLVTVTATPFVTPTSIPTRAPDAAGDAAPTIPVITTAGPATTPTVAAIPATLPPIQPTIAATAAQAPAQLAVLPSATVGARAVSAATLPPLATLPLPTPTMAATETAQPAPAAAMADSNCDTADLKLYHPARGDTISGAYTIIGDAHVGSGRFRIEVIPVGETAWRFIWEGYKSIQGESMMASGFQTTMFPNGAYLMKLTLVAASGDERLRCVVPFNIGN